MTVNDFKTLLTRTNERFSRRNELEAKAAAAAADAARRIKAVNATKASALLDGKPPAVDNEIPRLRDVVNEINSALPEMTELLSAEAAGLKDAATPLLDEVRKVYGNARTPALEKAISDMCNVAERLAVTIGIADVLNTFDMKSEVGKAVVDRLSNRSSASNDLDARFFDFQTAADELQTAGDIGTTIDKARALLSHYEAWTAPAKEKR
jgi:hypothetical protein